MGKCSYTWFLWTCPEPTWKGSKKYCIFHDRSEEKDIELFKQKLKEKLDKKDYEFTGYYFPEEVNFSHLKFEEDAYFSDATFQRNAYFSYATFKRNAYFIGATFRRNAYFNFAILQRNTDFIGATFRRNAYFNFAAFQNASFKEAIIRENLEFNPKSIEALDLRRTHFFLSGYITADLTKTRFHFADLENVAFIGCVWPERIYEEIHMDEENLTFKELETIYRDLKQNMQRHGDHIMVGKFFYREMEMKKKGSENKIKRAWLEIYNLLAGYGEKPERTAFSSLFIILAFAFIYWISECLDYAAKNIGHFEEFIYAMYFSFVTFTTLGLGDIKPLTHVGRILICCEAVIGAFLIALFVVVFARKMMR
ncbi:MAG: pentapeptide repeat-containing protein [Theionarchaea archaeon]|nr:pentapeptide repeat-containing protein [Theionarchaea archaeon]